MLRHGSEPAHWSRERDASREARALIEASSPPNPMKRWPEAKAIFEALPKERRQPINQRYKEARLAGGKPGSFNLFVIAELIEMGALRA